MHQALYRKYRPLDFDSVIGQNSIVHTLKNSIISNKINHAYMFFGPRGTGKTTLSKIFARSVNCSNPIDGCSCGKCDNCLHSYEKDCIDIIELDAASNNGVDEIREIINNVSLVPSYLKYKVYIIDEVHMLSIGAFNALLKTLEEPPEHVIFILATTDPQKVPETIISRCQCFSFKRISNDLIVERLKEVAKKEKIKIDDDVLEQIAISSNGGLRDSLVLLDQLSSYTDKKIDIDIYSEMNGSLTYKDIETFINYIFSGNINEVISLINTFNNKGKNLVLVINQIINYVRNCIVDNYISGKKINNVSLYIDFVNYFNENMFNIKKSDNPKIYFEILLIKFINDNNLVKEENTNLDENIEKDNINIETVVKNDIKEEIKSIDIEKNTENTVVEKEKTKDNKEKTKDNKEKTIVDLASFDERKLINFDEIMKARINNIFAKANKPSKTKFLSKVDLFKDYIFDTEIGSCAGIISDAVPLVVTSDNMVLLGLKYESLFNQVLHEYEKFEKTFETVLNEKYIPAFVDYSKWDDLKKEFIEKRDNGIGYTIMEEPEPIFEEKQINDIISSSAIDMFGDIVEISEE